MTDSNGPLVLLTSIMNVIIHSQLIIVRGPVETYISADG